MTFEQQVAWEAEIVQLERLEQEANPPYGVRCVRDICLHLRRRQMAEARAVRQLEGDKTRVYSAIEAQLLKMFGCRLHGTHECPHCAPV